MKLVKGMGVALAAAVVLAVPAIALTRVVSYTGAPATVSIESQDDPMANGLKAYAQSPAAEQSAKASQDDAPAEVRLQGWMFTGRGKPSTIAP